MEKWQQEYCDAFERANGHPCRLVKDGHKWRIDYDQSDVIKFIFKANMPELIAMTAKLRTRPPFKNCS